MRNSNLNNIIFSEIILKPHSVATSGMPIVNLLSTIFAVVIIILVTVFLAYTIHRWYKSRNNPETELELKVSFSKVSNFIDVFQDVLNSLVLTDIRIGQGEQIVVLRF